MDVNGVGEGLPPVGGEPYGIGVEYPPIASVVAREHPDFVYVGRDRKRITDPLGRLACAGEVIQQPGQARGADARAVSESGELIEGISIGGMPTPVAGQFRGNQSFDQVRRRVRRGEIGFLALRDGQGSLGGSAARRCGAAKHENGLQSFHYLTERNMVTPRPRVLDAAGASEIWFLALTKHAPMLATRGRDVNGQLQPFSFRSARGAVECRRRFAGLAFASGAGCRFTLSIWAT